MVDSDVPNSVVNIVAVALQILLQLLHLCLAFDDQWQHLPDMLLDAIESQRRFVGDNVHILGDFLRGW